MYLSIEIGLGTAEFPGGNLQGNPKFPPGELLQQLVKSLIERVARSSVNHCLKSVYCLNCCIISSAQMSTRGVSGSPKELMT